MKQAADGSAYITIEPLNDKERLLELYLAPGSTVGAASAVARYVNEKVASLGFQA